MGCYDELFCEMPLPGWSAASPRLQTKDLGCGMRLLGISSYGYFFELVPEVHDTYKVVEYQKPPRYFSASAWSRTEGRMYTWEFQINDAGFCVGIVRTEPKD